MIKIKFNTVSSEVIKWCVYIIILAAPFSKSIAEISVGLAITLWLLKKIVNLDFHIDGGALKLPLIIFIAATVPSIFNSLYPALSIRAFFTKVLKFALLYFVIVENINSKSRLKDLFTIALISMIIILIDGLIQYHVTIYDILHFYPLFKFRLGDILAGSQETFFRGFPTASFPFPNDFAAWILLTLSPLGCVTIFDLKKRRARYLTTLVFLGLSYLLFLAKVRSAWLGVALSMLYFVVYKKMAWLIVILVIMVAIPFLFRMEMAEYIFGFSSFGDRLAMWNIGWHIFKEHPIIGNGVNTFFARFRELREDGWRGKKGSYAHNCYLQMAADCGLVGLASFLWFIVSYFLSVAKGLKKVDDELFKTALLGTSLGIFAFLVQSFFDTNLYSLNLAMLFWCAMGIGQSTLKVLQSER